MIRTLSILAATIFCTVCALVIAGWLIWKSDIPREFLADTASDRLGRTVTIGALDGTLGWDPSLTLSEVTVAGTERDNGQDFLNLRALKVRLDGSELLKLRVAFRSIQILEADLNLHRFADGSTNWEFAAADGTLEGPDPLPEERQEFPVVHALIISDSRVRVLDDLNTAIFDFHIDTAEGQADAEPRGLQLEGKGSIQDHPLTVRLTGESVLKLQDEDEPYHLTAAIAAGDTKLDADIELTSPLKSQDMVAGFSLEGPDLARLFPLTGISLPNTPPYQLKGTAALTDTLLQFTEFEGRIGDSDIAGDVDIDLATDRPAVSANLVSDRLDFDDLAAIIGTAPDTSAGETASPEQVEAGKKQNASGKVIPDTPIDLSRMRAMDARLEYRAKRVQEDSLPIDNLSMTLSLQEGVLEIQPVQFGIGSGTLEAAVTVNASQDRVATQADMKIVRLPLAKVLRTFAGDLGDAEDAVGAVGGTIQLQAQGNSIREALANADGKLRIAMSEGRIGALLVELAGLDLAEALAVVSVGDGASATTPIRCIIMDFDILDGLMDARSLALDTKDTLILGSGNIDLGEEALALKLEPHPRDSSAAAVRSTILIDGTFRNPSVQPDKTDVAARVGIAAALGALLTPLAAILPFIDPGDDQPSPCRHLAEEAPDSIR